MGVPGTGRHDSIGGSPLPLKCLYTYLKKTCHSSAVDKSTSATDARHLFRGVDNEDITVIDTKIAIEDLVLQGLAELFKALGALRVKRDLVTGVVIAKNQPVRREHIERGCE